MKLGYILAVFALSACGTNEVEKTDAKYAERASESGGGSIASPAQTKPDYADTGKQMGWIDLSKDAVKQKLKDPDSAQFRNVNFYSGAGTPMVCGEVNSKNGFGGYGGFERFVAAGDSLQVVESEMQAGEMDTLWEKMCR